MFTSRIGCTALVALALVACAKDPVSQRQDGLDAIAADARSGDMDSDGTSSGHQIAILDACLPSDPAWAPTGGCAPHRGPSDVSFAEFNAFLTSPLSASVVGHQAWRNQPSYIVVEPDKTIQVRNLGGRLHTFTEVEQFGGGRVPTLNQGLEPAPECLVPSTTDVPPGGTLRFSEDEAGIERYQCCIHPWMRALVKVTPGHGGHGDH
jgi:hypothetical protein